MTVLGETLDQIRERLARYGGRSSSIGEQNTKAALIEPILRALGWDVEDPEEVWREYRRRTVDNPVDYALMILRTPRLFVEAKALGENLDDPKWASQIMSYAVVAGVEWVVLTNGDEYRIYNSHAAVPVEEKLFRTIRITDDGSAAAEVLGILSKDRTQEGWIGTLWKAHFIDRQMRNAIAGLFGPEPDPSLVRVLARRLPALSPAEIRAGLSRVRVQLDFPEASPALAKPHTPKRASANESRESPTWSHGNEAAATPWRTVLVTDLISAGLISPPLTLERTYKGRYITACLEPDGHVTFAGHPYESLSTSAGVARATVVGTPPGRSHPQTNGWIFWQFRDSDGQLKRLDILHQRYFEGRAKQGS
ncbi:MAG: type I restriction enzyme HsdR N-terminal domain-containing protein [Chloroflexota bacterium]|nr:type I restriction enzyme HsdR N-terminal domain-containing protein [Chloroflexota bacterium]